MQNRWLLIIGLMTAGMPVFSQNYHAVQGSSYAGSLGVGNNPASIVNTPFPWDVDVFSFQATNSTNALTVYKYSLLSSPYHSEYIFNKGRYSRFAYADFNVNLLNTRIALSRKKAIAFGINLRGYGKVTTGPYNFIDTLHSFRDFFALNDDNSLLHGDMTGSSWVEIFGTYGQTIWDNTADRLNAGITLKVTRGIAGAQAQVSNLRAQRAIQEDGVYYLLHTGQAQYGYSANFDRWQNGQSTSQNLRDFLGNTEGGLSIDLGVEYLLKPQTIPTWEEDTYYNYTWKIGVSLLDIGINQFKYGKNSRNAVGVRDDITDTLLDNKFVNVTGLESFNDSLGTIVNTLAPVRGKFSIANPARLVVNVDRHLSGAFYVNGNLSVNLSSLAGKKLYVSSQNLLAVTPRWETRRLGVYLPMQYNTEGQFWVGAAFKVGPLLLGIHNWGNIFSKNKMQNGGGYLALVIRSLHMTNPILDKRLGCPKL